MAETADDCITIADNAVGFPTMYFSIPAHYLDSVNSVLIPYGLVQDRIEKLAADICNDSEGQSLVLLCVLKGGYRFFNDLLDKIQAICRTSKISVPITIQFIRMKSYVDDASCGDIQVIGLGVLSELENKNVLVIEDIIDTGRTMTKLLGLIKESNAKSVKVASLLVKRTSKSNGYRPDYIGFEVPNHFIIGYAFDYNEYFRDLCHICIISDHGKKKYSMTNNS